MTNPDTNNPFDTAHPVVLYGGDLCNWNDAPAQFRFAADAKRFSKLVRNCETLEIWSYSFDHGLTLQKGPLLDYVKGMMEKGEEVACIFNGLSLMVFGPIDPEASSLHQYDTVDASEADDALLSEAQREADRKA